MSRYYGPTRQGRRDKSPGSRCALTRAEARAIRDVASLPAGLTLSCAGRVERTRDGGRRLKQERPGRLDRHSEVDLAKQQQHSPTPIAKPAKAKRFETRYLKPRDLKPRGWKP